MLISQADSQVEQEIIALERAALARWGRGDPTGYLELCAPDVVYFDPFTAHRIDGLEALTTYYEGIKGKISIERDEFLDARVLLIGSDVAVLTFTYASYGSEGSMRWYATEVFRRDVSGFRLIHTHWSLPTSPDGTAALKS
ncbi:MAG TPA: nuclear transport factor 2 family protein [Polyangiaceae bacterium]|nr:nuclear transport factor 2 family protein [Polyangiaceae bacterium]